MVDTPFLTWAGLKATGTTEGRTLPDRLAEIKNVKDWGAVGNGVIDDHLAIQAAINAASAAGVATSGSFLGSTVYFPPGAYNVGSTSINLCPGNASVRLLGAGKKASSIVGNVSGYVFNRADETNGVDEIEHLMITNNNSSGGGALRFLNSQQGRISSCSLHGFNALDVSSNAYCTIVSDTEIACAPGNGVGTVGVYAGEVGMYNCSVQNCAVGVQAYNSGFVFIGGRVEVNTIGFVLGKDIAGATSQLIGAYLSGFEMEGNNLGIYVHSLSSSAIIAATITGAVGEAHDSSGNTGQTATDGLVIHHAENCLFAAISTSVAVSGGYGINLTDASLSADRVEFLGCAGGGGGWGLPVTSRAGISYNRCDNPALGLLYRDLPGEAGFGAPPTAVEGMEFDITNSNTATWGATAAAGGSNHVKVRYNGTVWTVVGK